MGNVVNSMTVLFGSAKSYWKCIPNSIGKLVGLSNPFLYLLSKDSDIKVYSIDFNRFYYLNVEIYCKKGSLKIFFPLCMSLLLKECLCITDSSITGFRFPPPSVIDKDFLYSFQKQLFPEVDIHFLQPCSMIKEK